MITNLRRYVCDGCEEETVSENAMPKGWVFLSSTGGGMANSPVNFPVLVRIIKGRDLKVTRENIWCSAECMALWLIEQVGERSPS